MPAGTDIDANQSAVRRWQEAKSLHETGVVSPVPLVISSVHVACRMGRNTNLTGLTPIEGAMNSLPER
jgi:hypothetical protein